MLKEDIRNTLNDLMVYEVYEVTSAVHRLDGSYYVTLHTSEGNKRGIFYFNGEDIGAFSGAEFIEFDAVKTAPIGPISQEIYNTNNAFKIDIYNEMYWTYYNLSQPSPTIYELIEIVKMKKDLDDSNDPWLKELAQEIIAYFDRKEEPSAPKESFDNPFGMLDEGWVEEDEPKPHYVTIHHPITGEYLGSRIEWRSIKFAGDEIGEDDYIANEFDLAFYAAEDILENYYGEINPEEIVEEVINYFDFPISREAAMAGLLDAMNQMGLKKINPNGNPIYMAAVGHLFEFWADASSADIAASADKILNEVQYRIYYSKEIGREAYQEFELSVLQAINDFVNQRKENPYKFNIPDPIFTYPHLIEVMHELIDEGLNKGILSNDKLGMYVTSEMLRRGYLPDEIETCWQEMEDYADYVADFHD